MKPVAPAFLLCTLLAACSAHAPDAPSLTAAPETALGAQGLGHGPGIPSTLASAIRLDRAGKTVTLPLRRGVGPAGEAEYYVLIDTSDLREARRLGLNWAPKLRNALGTPAVQPVELGTGDREDRRPDQPWRGQRAPRFAGVVDFSPTLRVVPGPEGFPLDPASTPGSVGDAHYSPLVTAGDGVVYNAPILANATGLHDDVLSIDYARGEVTLRLVAGFYEGADVLYVNPDASDDDLAALESATYAPRLAFAPSAGDRNPRTSAREAIIPVVNGPMGRENTQRQGLRSAVTGEGDPLNIIREEPECSDPRDPDACSALRYSPLWDVHPVAWTPEAIAAGARRRLTSHEEVIALFRAGQLVSAAPGGPVNRELGGLRAAGLLVNCPPVFVAQTPK